MVWTLALAATAYGQPSIPADAAFDVLHYDARIEPDIAAGTISGSVSMRLVVQANNPEVVEFDRGDLVIDSVSTESEATQFDGKNRRLRVAVSQPLQAGDTAEITIRYHGTPRSGIRFFPNEEQVYTVFSTSQWMVCVDAPDDRATFHLQLVLPGSLHLVASGRPVGQHPMPDGRIVHERVQEHPVPTYTLGFAAGHFHEATEWAGAVQLRYLGTTSTDEELRHIFRDTRDMMAFFAEYAGMPYSDSSYTQVLAAGSVAQELSGFALLAEGYGKGVLENEREIWLIAHELAHQWWGNMVTYRDWNHFWLNEGMVSFMAAAYKGERFGPEEYQREIELFRKRYERVRAAGRDKPLVFPDWSHPDGDDRTLVYYKGAYVLHLLREELGEQAFREGIRYYTRTWWGRSVTTADFQQAMEQSSGRSLTEFFNTWVYPVK